MHQPLLDRPKRYTYTSFTPLNPSTTRCRSKKHPEQPARISSIYVELQDQGMVEKCVRIPSRAVSLEELQSAHTESHIETMLGLPSLSHRELNSKQGDYNSVFLNKSSLLSAVLSAGSVVELTERVANGKLKNALAIVRPPGHHAEPDCAMGFCLFGNCAIAAKEAREKMGKERVLIVDWDVHHGNGTQRVFEEDPKPKPNPNHTQSHNQRILH